MSHPQPTPNLLARLARDLAVGAAQVVADGRVEMGDVEPGEVDTKSTVTDLVTEIDRRTERWLIERIERVRPGDGVLGEEGGGRSGTTGVRWIVDPIDGTVNFVLGIPAYAVSVAAEVDGVVVAGAVCNPASGELFHAAAGGGAYLGESRLHGPRDVPLNRAVVGTGFGYDAAQRARQIAVVAPLLPRIADLRRIGSAALDLCFVAAGRLDAYFEAGLNEWDHAAGALIAQEAGCVVTGLRGRRADSRLVAAAGPALAPAFLAALEELHADGVTEISS